MSDTVRLPADTSIGSVHLGVANADRSADFYEGLLGLTVRPIERASAANDSGSALVRLSVKPGATRRPEGVTGLYHFAVLYPDRASLAVVLQRLIHAGWQFTGFADHGVSEAAYLLDPDGIGVELYVDRPREFWPRSADGSLTMYTRPLDIDGLLAEAGAAGNQPDPATIGHIHFHVADSRRSADFYNRVVGFDVILDAIPGAVFMSAGGYHHHLGVNTWARGRVADHAAAGLADWTIRVPGETDRGALIRRLDAAGARSGAATGGDPPGSAAGNPVVSAESSDGSAFVDPDGTVLIVEGVA